MFKDWDSDRVCILLSDSKATCLEQLYDNIPTIPFVYLYKKGASPAECFDLLRTKLPIIEAKYSKRALVYLWTGTLI